MIARGLRVRTQAITEWPLIIAAGGSAPAPPAFDPLAAFESGTYVGFLYNPRDAANLFQLSNGTTAVTNGDPVGYDTDLTGGGNHATQSVSGSRPTFPGLAHDGADDLMWVLQNATGTHTFSNFGSTTNPVSFICRVTADNASATAAGTAAAQLGAGVIVLRTREGLGYKTPFTFGFDANKLHYGVANLGGNSDTSVSSTGTIANGTDTTIGFTMAFTDIGPSSEVDYQLFIGGVLDSSGTISLPNGTDPVAVGANACDFVLGARTRDNGVPSNFLQGDLGPAVIINRTLTADDFADYHTWMMT